MARKLVVENLTDKPFVYPEGAGPDDYKIYFVQVPAGVRKHLEKKHTKRGTLNVGEYAEALFREAVMRAKPWEGVVVQDADGNYAELPYEPEKTVKIPESIKADILEKLNEPVERTEAELKNSSTSHINSSTTKDEPAPPVD